MLTGAVAALAGALCWTFASGLWRRLPTALSSGQLNLLKNLLALLTLAPWLWLSDLESRTLVLLALSGVVGIAAGDSFYFAALRRLGTRRTLTLDAGGPAVTALLGLVALSEVPTIQQWLGLGLITAALWLVALQRSPEGQRDRWGVLLALAALLCGSVGALLARAALRDDAIEPLAAAAWRLAAASAVLLPLLPGLWGRSGGPRPAGARWPLAMAATLLGTTAGIALQQTALQRLPGAMAVALLATAPVMALPLAALEGDRPGWWGVAAALLALLGDSCVVA